MIDLYIRIIENANGKTETTIWADRVRASGKEEIQANEVTLAIAESIAKNAKDGSTIVHRPIPSEICCCEPPDISPHCKVHGGDVTPPRR